MKRRKIWANLSTAVLMAAPAAASAGTLTDQQPAAIEAKADQGRIHLAQHQGHGGAAGRFEKLEQVALVQAFILLAHDLLEARVLPAT